ncbi:OB-fold domain-containing protein [Nocardiopsis sp. CNT-189]|uniref:Zn-ribbon domain-containing OB-fold protein n=1 Tax=Nocardiopsis oceanisediminis TaxID=2816862 RepID=UPI003B387949
MTEPARPRPGADRDSAGWWELVRGHRLTVQGCTGCGLLRFPAREFCPACRSRSWEWRDSAGTGRVAAWTVTHRPFHPAFAAETPYTVLRVALDDGPGLHCWGRLAGAGPEVLAAGLPVEAVFTDAEPGLTLVDWRPAAAPR